jgi:hypothetical protein
MKAHHVNWVPTMMRGVCKLCLLEMELQASHFLPAALYKSILQPEEKNPHPYFMSPTKTVESSQQIKDYLLCRDCEMRFNQGGERYVLSVMARSDSFPLQETLRKATPIRAIKGLTTFAGSAIPEIDIDKLEYFALSIFWRAAAHNWKPAFGETYKRLELGPYREELRKYLLGGEYPKHLVTTISVYEEEEFTRAMYPPASGNSHPYKGRSYSFLIPGIDFNMLVGKRMETGMKELSSHLGPERRIFMTPLINDGVNRLRIDMSDKQQKYVQINKKENQI